MRGRSCMLSASKEVLPPSSQASALFSTWKIMLNCASLTNQNLIANLICSFRKEPMANQDSEGERNGYFIWWMTGSSPSELSILSQHHLWLRCSSPGLPLLVEFRPKPHCLWSIWHRLSSRSPNTAASPHCPAGGGCPLCLSSKKKNKQKINK